VRLLRIFIALILLVLIPFFIWGDQLMAMFDATEARMWIQNFGAWGPLAVIGLLISDLFLPIPATGVMSAAGFVYGPWIGGLISLAGSLLCGMLAYVLSRAFGRRAAEWLAGAEGLNQNERLFEKSGPWLVVLSRWLPVLPEVVACLAGIARMPAGLFLAALFCGTVPPAFTYAAVGALFDSEPMWALGLSILLPVILWLAFRPFLRARQSNPPADS
jgi:uncharacterized membrane protein YdjX (TVP38/TMEM64 family)